MYYRLFEICFGSNGRWVLGGIFLILCAYITVVQLAYVGAVLLKKTTKRSSLVPAFLFGLIGLVILPDPKLFQRWFWAPIVPDPFIYMIFFGPLIGIIRKLKEKS